MTCMDSSLKCAISPFEDVKLLKEKPLPRHVAIIMDGNRRWQKRREASPFSLMGHCAGASAIEDILQTGLDLGIQVITVFGFSTENWKRSRYEVEGIWHILENYLRDKCRSMVKKGIRFDTIGDITPLPCSVQQEIEKVKSETKQGQNLDFVMALNYGGRDEIKRVCAKMAQLCVEGKLTPNQITERLMERFLDTSAWGDPDLLIRTSGEMRISNFLLYQMAYAELYITDVLWPDFSPTEFLKAIAFYQERDRRKGQ